MRSIFIMRTQRWTDSCSTLLPCSTPPSSALKSTWIFIYKKQMQIFLLFAKMIVFRLNIVLFTLQSFSTYIFIVISDGNELKMDLDFDYCLFPLWSILEMPNSLDLKNINEDRVLDDYLENASIYTNNFFQWSLLMAFLSRSHILIETSFANEDVMRDYQKRSQRIQLIQCVENAVHLVFTNVCTRWYHLQENTDKSVIDTMVKYVAVNPLFSNCFCFLIQICSLLLIQKDIRR